jgi:glycosyltransferase involved in cell wall biosynthesis
MSHKVEISAVIPHYNHGNYVGQQVAALLAQSCPPREIVIVDDSSRDQDFSILLDIARTDGRVRVIRSGGRLGPARATNMGIDLISSPHVFLGAADDWVLPGFFEESANALAFHPEAGLVCGDEILFDEETGFRWRRDVGMTPGYLRGDEVCAQIRRRLLFAGSSVVCNVEALKRIGKLRPELNSYTDGFSNLVLGLRHGLCYIPKPFSVHRLNRANYHTLDLAQSSLPVMRELIKLIRSAEFADVFSDFRRCAPSHMFGGGLLRAALERDNRSFLSPKLLFGGVITGGRSMFVRGLERLNLKGQLRTIMYRTRRYSGECDVGPLVSPALELHGDAESKRPAHRK